jgi:hypothetical protein
MGSLSLNRIRSWRPRRPSRTVVIAAATTLVLAAGTGIAVAAINSPVSSSGMISGCYTNASVNGSHVFVLQDQGTSCPKGTTPISWAQSGPAGPVGPAGAAGPSGPSGPQGPPGPTTTLTTTATSTVTATVTQTGTTTPPTTTPPTTTPPTLTVEPGTICNVPEVVGTVNNSGQSVSAGGVNVGTSSSWFTVTFGSNVTSWTVSVAGAPFGAAAAGKDVLTVATDCAGTALAVDVASYSGTGPATLYIEVSEGPSGGSDGGYELTAAAS